MHLDEEQLQRLLHGELVPSAEAAARHHFATCSLCRERTAQAEREETEVHAWLRHVDHPPPELTAETIAARARGDRLRWERVAAGIALAAGLAAGHAMGTSQARAAGLTSVGNVGAACE
ncbi:MAG: anti-sigma factor family protein, partial [Gemmatimonadales bacterium]